MSLAAELFTVLAPAFLTAAAGFAWAKRRLAFDHAFITTLIASIGSPCLIFSTFLHADVDPAALGIVALAMGVCVLAFAGIGSLGLKLLGLPIRVHLPTLINPNTGNMGLPVSYFAFGQEGLAFAVAIFAMLNIVTFTLNVWIASGRATPLESLKQPPIWAVFVAAIVLAAGLDVPRWIDNTATLIGGMAVPLMLLALGVSIAELQVAHLRRSLGLGLWRIAMGFGVSVAVAEAFGLGGVSRGVLILQASMPSAVFTFLFAQIYDQRPAEVAGTIVMSTLLSVATLPLVLYFVLP